MGSHHGGEALVKRAEPQRQFAADEGVEIVHHHMPALVEVHNQAELETALDLDVQILGINNRNLVDLSIDLETTNNLVNVIPPGLRQNLVLVSESGLKTPGDLRRVEGLVDAVLMGTAFMENPEPSTLLRTLFGKR